MTEAVHSIRDFDLKKPPSIGETLDWAHALLLLNADRLSPETVRESLSALIKYPADREQVLEKMGSVLASGQDTE